MLGLHGCYCSMRSSSVADEMLPGGINPARHSAADRLASQLGQESFRASPLPLSDKLEAFSRFSSKRSVARFLAKYEIYKRILNISGVIIECGVYNGAGMFTWPTLANIFEPANHTRKVIGFDTFSGLS